jgi:glycosyltransferase involved in cell wall biosynthesis
MNQKRTRIAIDALGIEKFGGARTSILNLLKHYIKQDTEAKIFIFLTQKETELDQENVKQIVLPLARGIFTRIIMQIIMPLFVLIRGIDLVHFTKNQASLVFGPKIVFSIHDVTILRHPEIHPRISVWFWRFIQPMLIKRADKITTVSKDSRNDLIHFYQIPEDKIEVIYNATQFDQVPSIDPDQENEIKKNLGVPDSYLLIVGKLALRKNLDTIIKAVYETKVKIGKTIPLFIVGGKYTISDASGVIDLIKEMDLTNDIIYTGEVSREELQVIYKNATIYLFPSIHEGFGIPLIEAMQFGVPLIASKSSALPEIMGDAGILVEDFLSPQAWSDAIVNLTPEKRAELKEKGLARSRQFSWQASAQQLSNVYRTLLHHQKD